MIKRSQKKSQQRRHQQLQLLLLSQRKRTMNLLSRLSYHAMFSVLWIVVMVCFVSTTETASAAAVLFSLQTNQSAACHSSMGTCARLLLMLWILQHSFLLLPKKHSQKRSRSLNKKKMSHYMKSTTKIQMRRST